MMLVACVIIVAIGLLAAQIDGVWMMDLGKGSINESRTD